MAGDSFIRRARQAVRRNRRRASDPYLTAHLTSETLEVRALLSIGAELIADLNTSPASSSPQYLVNVGGLLFFTADDGVHGRELWKSDGTSTGTSLVKDLTLGPADTQLASLIAFGSRLAFTAFDGNHRSLWTSDGTPAGTQILADVGVYELALVGGILFFQGTDESSGSELWRSDGTSSGTRLVRDLVPGPDGAHPQHLINVAGTLFFATETDAYGGELWKSDGTCSGTVLVRDIRSGWRGSSPEQLAVVGDRLYFVATDREHGTELWTSDGTLEGTILVSDMNPGPFGSDPEDLTVVGDRVYFTANEPARGREIWRTAAVAGALSANGLAGAASELPVSSLPRAPTASDSPRETRSIVTPVADAPAGNVIDQLLGGGDFDWLLFRLWQDLLGDEPSWGGDDGGPDTRLR